MSGAEAPMIIAMLASTGMQMKAAHDNEKRADNIAKVAARNAAERTGEIGASVTDFAKANLDPAEVARKTIDAETDLTSRMRELTSTVPQEQGLGRIAKSQDFQRDLDAGNTRTAQNVLDFTKRLAKIQAPGAVQFSKGMSALDLQRKLNDIGAERTALQGGTADALGRTTGGTMAALGAGLGAAVPALGYRAGRAAA